jgi:hypothetical protein
MATGNPNFFKIEGTVYAKPSRKITSKKDGKEYEFKSIILELKREHKGKTYTELPEFQLGYSVDDSGFDIGDSIQVSFSLTGKEISATFHKTELKALYIKHADIDSVDDTRDVGGEPFRPPKAKVPEPLMFEEDLDSNDPLPF